MSLSNTNFYDYFPRTAVPNVSACLPITVRIVHDAFDVEPLWIGLAFLFGFLLGAAIVALFARPCLRDWARKKRQDEEELEAAKMGVSLREYRQLDTGSPNKHSQKQSIAGPIYIEAGLVDGKMRGSTKKGKKKYLDNEDEAVDVDVRAVVSKGLSDVLVQTNSDSAEAELVSQDFDSVLGFDKDLQGERQMAFLTLLRITLNKLKQKEKIDDKFCDNFLRKTEEEMQDIVKLCDKEKDEEAETLKKNPKFSKHPEQIESEIENLEHEFNQKEMTMLKEYRSKVRRELIKSSGLSEAEVDSLLQKLKENLTRLEERLRMEQLRQAKALEDRLNRRRQLAQMKQLQDSADKEEFTLRHEALDNVMTDLVQDGKIQEKQREEILAEYNANMKALQERFGAENRQAQLALADKLKHRRAIRQRKLASKQDQEKHAFIETANKDTKTVNFIEGYHDLLERHRMEEDQIVKETDSSELLEFEKLRKDQSKQKQQEIEEQERKISDALQERTQLNSREVDRLLKLYHQQTEYYKRQQLAERQRHQMVLQEKLEKRRLRTEMEDELVQAEQDSVIEREENAIKKTIEGNMELDEDARARILEEYHQNQISLNNHLQMSRIKQQKNLERRLSQRRAKLADWKEQQQTTKRRKSIKNEKEREKHDQELDKQVTIEENKIEEERIAAISQLRKNLLSETETLLKEQDAELGILIGRLQVGQARRQAIMQKQDKTLQELQEQLEKKVTENVELPRNETEQIIQQHYNQVANLNDQIQRNRERQEYVLKEKLAMKKIKKSRDIQSELEQETRENYYTQRDRGSKVATTIFSQTLHEQRHKKKMNELERELKVDLERQRDELNRQLEVELQNELQTQQKDFLAQLAAVSSLSKDELDEVVQSTVASKGGDSKTAKKLAKDLRQDLRRAKSSLGIEEDRDEGYPELAGMRRARTSIEGYDNDRFENNVHRPQSGKKKRFLKKPKTAFGEETEHRQYGYSAQGDDDDDF